MGKVSIKKVAARENEFMNFSISALLESMRVSKIAGNYHIWLGGTEVEISADLMKDFVENAFMMLDYEDQVELLKTFSEYVR